MKWDTGDAINNLEELVRVVIVIIETSGFLKTTSSVAKQYDDLVTTFTPIRQGEEGGKKKKS